jgi:hypothetical protein
MFQEDFEFFTRRSEHATIHLCSSCGTRLIHYQAAIWVLVQWARVAWFFSKLISLIVSSSGGDRISGIVATEPCLALIINLFGSIALLVLAPPTCGSVLLDALLLNKIQS